MDWKQRAYELYINQIEKDLKIIKEQIQEEFEVDFSKDRVKKAIYRIKSRNMQNDNSKSIKDEKESLPNIYDNNYKHEWNGTEYMKIGIVSDTHLCNKSQQLTHLRTMYDIFESEGITEVYHAGDITDGYYKHDDSRTYDLIRIGADQQVEYTCEVYPKKPKIKTYFILGNHDLTHIRNGGVNIGKRISEKRDDLIYLGSLNARIHLTRNCVMELNHPLDGASYALSYAIQKMVDTYHGGDKPHILINGHHHKYINLDYRNVFCIEAGCFEWQTAFMRGKRISANVGGLILHIKFDKDGFIKSIMPEWYPFYNKVENDY